MITVLHGYLKSYLQLQLHGLYYQPPPHHQLPPVTTLTGKNNWHTLALFILLLQGISLFWVPVISMSKQR